LQALLGNRVVSRLVRPGNGFLPTVVDNERGIGGCRIQRDFVRLPRASDNMEEEEAQSEEHEEDERWLDNAGVGNGRRA
jgi:hypothetical protein